MMRGLLEKELRQHGFMLAFLGVLLLGGLVIISGHGPLSRAGGGGFAAVQLLHFTFVPLACIVLGQALIAAEFRQKTQLFLEGLPLPRWRMLAVKFLLGLVTLLGSVGLALGFAWWRARHSEAMTPQFVWLLALKSAGWVWFFYTLCFAHAFLGRYRVVFAVAVLFGLLFASAAGFELSAVGPFALVDSRFGYERLIVPREALISTAALGAALTGLGFTLGLVRDATVASLLAEKMSAREKIFLTLLVFAALMVGTSLSERQKAAVPVLIPGAVESRHGVVQVLASAAVDAPSKAETAALAAAARDMAEKLDALAEYLDCRTFPVIFLVHRRDLDANEFINGDLKPRQGVLVRVNLTADEFRTDALEDWLLREALVVHRGGLAGRERNAWVLDGIPWWWRQSEHGTKDALDAAARSAAGAVLPADFSRRHLHAWYAWRDKIGEDKARQFAGAGLAVLAKERGTEAQRQFLRAMFSQALPPDLRGWWRDFRDSTPSRLRTATFWTEADLIREWKTALTVTEGPPP